MSPEPSQELKDAATAAARDRGLEWHGMEYHGTIIAKHDYQVACTHGIQSPFPDRTPVHRTVMQWTKMRKGDKIIVVLVGVCEGKVLHWADVAPPE